MIYATVGVLVLGVVAYLVKTKILDKRKKKNQVEPEEQSDKEKEAGLKGPSKLQLAKTTAQLMADLYVS